MLTRCLAETVSRLAADEEVGCIGDAIVLPDAWMRRVLANLPLADEVVRVQQQRTAS